MSRRGGLACGIGAYLLWGLLPAYFKLVASVSPGEIVAQRVIWSVLLLVPLILLLRRWKRLKAAFAHRRLLAMLAASAALIAVNWLLYVWAVVNGHVLAASLAYFLNPLINVALGFAFLRERLRPGQAVALLLAVAGVAILALGAGSGVWISLAIAFSFALYGLLRKLAPVGALEGLTVETLLLSPAALGYALWLGTQGTLAIGQSVGMTLLLVLGGVVTTVPLLLFAEAARALELKTLGLLQYLAPSLQFLLAVLAYGEALTAARLACFGLIWAGLALYIASSLRLRPVPAA